jgi:hypothetical protein
MAEDRDWTTAPMPELVREQHEMLVKMEEIQTMYRRLAEAELEPLRIQLANLRVITQERTRREYKFDRADGVAWGDQ